MNQTSLHTFGRRSVLCLTAVLLFVSSTRGEEKWSYVAESDDPGFRFSSGVLTLTASRPEDLVVEFAVPPEARYGQFRYGSLDSRRVAVVLIPAGDESQLFVDTNRDRQVQKTEKIEGAGPVWELPLDSELVVGEKNDTALRHVRMRFVNGVFTIATKGFIAGQAKIGNEQFDVRRVDATGNGQFTDETDYLWIDLNGDGKWNVFSERFRYSSILVLKGKRYSTSSDRRGHRLLFSENDSSGKIGLKVSDDVRSRGLESLSVVLAGKSGAIAHLDLLRPAEVPADDYRPVSIQATFTRKKAPRIWSYTFVSDSTFSDGNWTPVAADADVSIDPFFKIRFVGELNRTDSIYAPGSEIITNPRLRTADGLYLQAAFYGRNESESVGEPNAVVEVVEHDSGVSIGRKKCGFT